MPSPIGNFFVKAIVNSPFHPLLGDSIAVISVDGWKTGRRVSTPINVRREQDGWIVISMRKRTWWRNLRGGRTALLRLAGRQIPVRGDIVEARDEVIANLADYFRHNPGLVKYFDVQLDPEGNPDPAGLERESLKRVFIKLYPA